MEKHRKYSSVTAFVWCMCNFQRRVRLLSTVNKVKKSISISNQWQNSADVRVHVTVVWVIWVFMFPGTCRQKRKQPTCTSVCACEWLTKKSRGGDSSIATGDHDTDPGLNKGHGEVNDLWPFLIDGEWAHCHVGILQHHLRVNHRQTETGRRETWPRVSRHLQQGSISGLGGKDGMRKLVLQFLSKQPSSLSI